MDPELTNLVTTWYQASGPARDMAFNALVTYMGRNPQVAQEVEQGVILAAYEVHLLRLFAQGAAARIAQRRALPTLAMHMARVGVNLGRMPKIPNPVATGIIFIGAILLAGCEAKAEDDARQAAKPSYDLYVIKYLQKCVHAKEIHPNAQLTSPQEFEEWYQENRT
jgi:hypothetical protein